MQIQEKIIFSNCIITLYLVDAINAGNMSYRERELHAKILDFYCFYCLYWLQQDLVEIMHQII